MILKELFFDVGPFCFASWVVQSRTTVQFLLRVLLFFVTVPLFLPLTVVWAVWHLVAHFRRTR